VEPVGFDGGPAPLEEQMADAAEVWPGIVRRHGLRDLDVGTLASWWHTDADLGRTIETFTDMGRSRRLGFVTALSKEFDARPYPPNYLVFAKGDEADKLIITGMMDGQFNTVYSTRALLADLTASARLTDFFQKNAIAEYATFLDFLKLLGFKQVTVTDGENFAQQIKIE